MLKSKEIPAIFVKASKREVPIGLSFSTDRENFNIERLRDNLRINRFNHMKYNPIYDNERSKYFLDGIYSPNSASNNIVYENINDIIMDKGTYHIYNKLPPAKRIALEHEPTVARRVHSSSPNPHEAEKRQSNRMFKQFVENMNMGKLTEQQADKKYMIEQMLDKQKDRLKGKSSISDKDWWNYGKPNEAGETNGESEFKQSISKMGLLGHKKMNMSSKKHNDSAEISKEMSLVSSAHRSNFSIDVLQTIPEKEGKLKDSIYITDEHHESNYKPHNESVNYNHAHTSHQTSMLNPSLHKFSALSSIGKCDSVCKSQKKIRHTSMHSPFSSMHSPFSSMTSVKLLEIMSNCDISTSKNIKKDIPDINEIAEQSEELTQAIDEYKELLANKDIEDDDTKFDDILRIQKKQKKYERNGLLTKADLEVMKDANFESAKYVKKIEKKVKIWKPTKFSVSRKLMRQSPFRDVFHNDMLY